MKQKDIALIAMIVVLSGIASVAVSRLVFAKPQSRKQKVEVVDVITADFPTPDSKYFNPNSIDPTHLIQIGDSTNPNPFTSKSQ